MRPFTFIGPYLIPLRPGKVRVSIGLIKASVCDHFCVPLSEMTSSRRAQEVVRPRQVAMYLSKQLTPMSLPQIGRNFGGRDHTTVMHAIRQVESLRGRDRAFNAHVEALAAELEAIA